MKITTRWSTYRVGTYTHDVPGSDRRSAGGVHLHQARRSGGRVLVRVVQSNGMWRHATAAEEATADQLATIEAAK